MSVVMYKFSAEWCQPCKSLSKTLEDVDMKGVVLKELDMDAHPEEFKAFGIRGVPTLIIMNNNKELVRKVGALNRTQVQQLIDSVYYE